MPGRRSARPHRTKGSWVPRLAGVGAVAVLAVAGLVVYVATTHHQHQVPPKRHGHALVSSRVLKIQNVGIVDFGPADDGDSFVGSQEDHPMMLLPRAGRVRFVAIPASGLAAPTSGGAGVPVWTDNQMADGSDIFIYGATGQCLSAGQAPALVRLAHCDLAPAQRWRPIDAASALGEVIARYANVKTGLCLTAPRKKPGPARLAKCSSAMQKRQEIAFWWTA
jgi:hypothetical protein